MLNQGLHFLNVTVTIGVFLSVTLTLFLLFRQSAKSKANIFLGFIMLHYVFYMMSPFLYGMRLLESFPHFIRLGGLFGFVLGPLIWLYVLACTQKNFQMQRKYYLHFIPLILSLLYNMPFILLDGAAKYVILEQFVETGSYNQHPGEPMLKALHQLGYFLLSISVILKYRKHITTTSSSIDLTFHRWLLFFSSVLLFPLVGILIFVFGNYQFALLYMLLISVFIFVVAVYAAVLLKPRIFQKFPNQVTLIPAAEEEKQKYESSNLQENQKDKLVKKLIEYVESEKPYQEPELTLGDLSKQVNIPTHYLSQVINEKINRSFLDFINSYRVEAAKNMLADSKFSHYTIIAIAFEAGFNSKTAFYTAFKKFTDVTPSKYRKSFKDKDLSQMSA